MRFTILFLTCGLAFAQLETNTVTITASRNVSVVADQVVYRLSLTTDVSATLDDVVGQLGGAGITAANLSHVWGRGDPVRSVEWSLELVTPFSKMKETVAALARVKEKLGSADGSPLVFSAATARTSTEAQSQACPLTSLVSDARREADRIASAAGVKVGGIVGLSDGSGGGVPTAILRGGVGIPGGASRGTSTGVPYYFSSDLIVHSVPSSPCSLTVQFRLLP